MCVIYISTLYLYVCGNCPPDLVQITLNCRSIQCMNRHSVTRDVCATSIGPWHRQIWPNPPENRRGLWTEWNGSWEIKEPVFHGEICSGRVVCHNGVSIDTTILSPPNFLWRSNRNLVESMYLPNEHTGEYCGLFICGHLSEKFPNLIGSFQSPCDRISLDFDLKVRMHLALQRNLTTVGRQCVASLWAIGT